LIVAWWRLRPAGSLLHIFAFAAVASIPNQPPLWQGMLVAALTVAFSLLIGISSRVIRSHRTPWVRPRPPRLAPGEKRAARLESVGYIVVAAVAGTRGTLAGKWLGFGHNYWAMVAAVVPLAGHSTRHRVSRGMQRIVGTALGLVLLAGILWLQPAPWQTELVIAACQFGAEMFFLRQGAGPDRGDRHRGHRRRRRRAGPDRRALPACTAVRALVEQGLEQPPFRVPPVVRS
jgi:hypothetical protein